MLFPASRGVASKSVGAQACRSIRTATYFQEPSPQSIKVKCGVWGDTTIHVHNTPISKPLPLLLYISPNTGSQILPSSPPQIPLSFLSKSHTTVVISPPFSQSTPFPQPLHILSYVYSYLQEEHAKFYHMRSRSSKPSVPSIAIYGKGLGGTLATALALTECRPSETSGRLLGALMTRDSIYDYAPLAMEYLQRYAKTTVTTKPQEEFSMNDYLSPDSDLAFDDYSPPSNAYVSGATSATSTPDPAFDAILEGKPQSREDLIKTLPHLFARPEVAFDPFISPLLFFRGRSHEIPTSWTWDGPQRSSAKVSLEERVRSRSYKKYPRDVSLRLPWARLCVSGEAEAAQMTTKRGGRGGAKKAVAESRGGELQHLYSEQAELMAAGMRRGIEKEHEDSRLLGRLKDVDAADRVQVVHTPDVGSEWNDRTEMDGVAMTEWLTEVTDWKR